MKSLPSGLATHYAGNATTLAHALKITRADGGVYRFTSHDRDRDVLGETYLAAAGLDVTSLVNQLGLAVDNLELRVLYDDATITRSDLLAGKWDNAAFVLYEFNWASPADGVNTLLRGTTGEVQIGRTSGYTIELRSLKQSLQRQRGMQTQRTCRYRLGSTAMPAGLCKVNLATFTTSNTVTGVTSNQVFANSARVEAAGWYQEGQVTFLTGLNAGLTRKVKSFAAGVFTTTLALPFTVQVGDTFSAIAGCQKRLTEDCKTKFNNVLNFGAEPHLVGVDALTASPVQDK